MSWRNPRRTAERKAQQLSTRGADSAPPATLESIHASPHDTLALPNRVDGTILARLRAVDPIVTASRIARLALACAVLTAILPGCAALPPLEGRTESSAPTDTADTPLGRALEPRVRAHPGLSGVFALPDPHDAFAARVLLARAAARTLDVQYYIWHEDLSGTLLIRELLDAADRGVRVRLLLDDNNTRGMDGLLAALDAHPSIEVRLFNPFVIRDWRLLGYLTDFSRLNRRMHNKSFTADNQATIVGGRNVGDEYFGAGAHTAFADLDVLAAGPVAREVSAAFDRYWASDSAYPASLLLPLAQRTARQELDAHPTTEHDASRAQAYREAIVRAPFVRDLLAGQLPLEWTRVRTLADDPAKGLGKAREEDLLLHRMRSTLGTPTAELVLVSPYFVPTAVGTDAFREIARSGVAVTVLTNALEATDVLPVHAGYARWRRDLLEAGVTLYELRRTANTASPKEVGLTGSSGSSLHAKTFEVDRARVFVGSFNFDPRSWRLNTEMGFVIESPAMAETLADTLNRELPALAYRVRLDPAGRMQWVERTAAGEVVHDSEPGASLFRRIALGVLSVLPIEWML